MFPNGQPRKLLSSITADLLEASGNSLHGGCIPDAIQNHGKNCVQVLKHFTKDIIGINLIHKQRLFYGTVFF
jgi:hypothetical protein